MRIRLAITTRDGGRKQVVDLAVTPPAPWSHVVVVTGFETGSTIRAELVDASGVLVQSLDGGTVP
jgi:hypothetical protein